MVSKIEIVYVDTHIFYVVVLTFAGVKSEIIRFVVGGRYSYKKHRTLINVVCIFTLRSI